MSAISSMLDLVYHPFTLPGSRVMVLRNDWHQWAAPQPVRFRHLPPATGLSVYTSEYERDLAECAVMSILVLEVDNQPLPVTAVYPDRIEFEGGAVVLTFADTSTLMLTITSAAQEAGACVTASWQLPDGSAYRESLTDTDTLRFQVGAGRSLAVSRAPHDDAQGDAAAQIWSDWFARCPLVSSSHQQIVALCWWVLGANTLELPALGSARAIVPSKIGYVGVWQWDAYFIAIGVRHGDPALAREQLEIAFRYPRDDGQLPDVIHEAGVLASSDDLPVADQERLRRAGSHIADPQAPIPLTKPPLAALAMRKVLEVEDHPAWAHRYLDVVRRSQDWWFAVSDIDGDGLPEYGHPYSSGLDDSPVFDGPLPITSPDLAAYLIRQDMELCTLRQRYQSASESQLQRYRDRIRRTTTMLLELWNPVSGRFEARGAGEQISSDTICGLIPLIIGTLPASIHAHVLDSLLDQDRYGTTWRLPTVSGSDPDFSAERMWRGPVWLNTSWLVVEGLLASGDHTQARDLARHTVELVIHAGGPFEYFNPVTGLKAKTATSAFGWSAALVIDLAVRLASSGDLGGGEIS